MLIGQVLRSAMLEFTVTRDVFSFEPYGFMIERGDTEFRLVVDRALAKLYRSARIRRHYYDWFGRFRRAHDADRSGDVRVSGGD